MTSGDVSQLWSGYRRIIILKGPLINSGLDGWRDEMFRIKAKSAGNSVLFAKIFNAEPEHFSRQTPVHELIRGSLMSHGGEDG